MLDRDWLDALIRDVFRSLDSETTMSYDEQMAAWEGMRRLKEAILAAPPVPLSDPADEIKSKILTYARLVAHDPHAPFFDDLRRLFSELDEIGESLARAAAPEPPTLESES